MEIIKRGKLLSEDEHFAFIDLIGKKRSIDTNMIPHIKTSNEFKHLFMVSGSRLQLEHDRNVFSKMIRSLRQKNGENDIPVFRYNASTKKYDVIKKINPYLEAVAIKFLKSAYNSLHHREDLQKRLERIINEL